MMNTTFPRIYGLALTSAMLGCSAGPSATGLDSQNDAATLAQAAASDPTDHRAGAVNAPGMVQLLDGGHSNSGTHLNGEGRNVGNEANKAENSVESAISNAFTEVVSPVVFRTLLPNRDPMYSYEALATAAASYPRFCNDGDLATRRREAAAFLANIAHATTGGWPMAPGGTYAWGLHFTQEVGCESGGCPQYCNVADTRYRCSNGHSYYGRGPIQLTWNFNYGRAGEALGIDLLRQPELVAKDPVVGFRSAIWFWMTPHTPKPSAHDVIVGNWRPAKQDIPAKRTPGFGMTVNIINGGVECARTTPLEVEDRIGFYRHFAEALGTTPGSALLCNDMEHY